MESQPKTNVHLLTFATHEKGALSVLTERSKSAGFKVHILGVGTLWKGFGWRMKCYHQQILKMLRTEACRPYDLFVLVDGYDVIPFGTPVDVLDGFQKYHTDVLISAESNCTPYMLPAGEDPFKLYLPQCYDHPFLNAGGIVGTASGLALFLGDVIKTRKVKDQDDDQAAFTRYYLSNLQEHKSRREKAGLLPIRAADQPIVCIVESSDEMESTLKTDSQDLDLAVTAPELSGTKKSTPIKVCLDTNCMVFQCSEFDEQFLQPFPQMGSHGRYWNSRTKTYPSFLHLPGKPAMLNLSRVLECKSLLDPRELLEAICKGVSSAPTANLSPPEGSKPHDLELKVASSPSHILLDKKDSLNVLESPKLTKLSRSINQDPIEKLEAYVIKYGEEASKHIAAGMKLLSQRLPRNVVVNHQAD